MPSFIYIEFFKNSSISCTNSYELGRISGSKTKHFSASSFKNYFNGVNFYIIKIRLKNLKIVYLLRLFIII